MGLESWVSGRYIANEKALEEAALGYVQQLEDRGEDADRQEVEIDDAGQRGIPRSFGIVGVEGKEDQIERVESNHKTEADLEHLRVAEEPVAVPVQELQEESPVQGELHQQEERAGQPSRQVQGQRDAEPPQERLFEEGVFLR